MAIDKVNKYNQIREKIELGGGQEKIEKQHKANKLTARERLITLFDESSFVELDAFIKPRTMDAIAEGVVTGYGTVDGRLVYAYAQDFTVIGGSIGEMHSKKICRVVDHAMKMGAPVVSMIDSAGARLQEGMDALASYGDVFFKSTVASGVIPQISMVLGACAGAATFVPALADFTVMVQKSSQMFVTGPQVLGNMTGNLITGEELGGANIHGSKSGMADFVYANEAEAFSAVRELIRMLPNNNLEGAPMLDAYDELNRVSEELNTLIVDENSVYDMHNVVVNIVDDGYFIEASKDFAKNILTGFARLNGRTVGVIANQPMINCGILDSKAADKAARFIRTCDGFQIPVLTIVDTPGFELSVEAEQAGLAKYASKMIYAYAEATVAKVTMVIGKAYGSAYMAMCPKSMGADMVYAWPNGIFAAMEPMSAAAILFSEEIAKAEDPIVMREEKAKQYIETEASAYVAASKGHVDDIIEPAMSRPMIINALEMLASKREQRPVKKHGNMPV